MQVRSDSPADSANYCGKGVFRGWAEFSLSVLPRVVQNYNPKQVAGAPDGCWCGS